MSGTVGPSQLTSDPPLPHALHSNELDSPLHDRRVHRPLQLAALHHTARMHNARGHNVSTSARAQKSQPTVHATPEEPHLPPSSLELLVLHQLFAGYPAAPHIVLANEFVVESIREVLP